jgi:hypothetical protein
MGQLLGLLVMGQLLGLPCYGAAVGSAMLWDSCWVCHVMGQLLGLPCYGAAVGSAVFYTPHRAHIEEITTAIESTKVLLTGT